MWAEGGTPHGLFCGLLRRAKRVCAFCVLPFCETAISKRKGSEDQRLLTRVLYATPSGVSPAARWPTTVRFDTSMIATRACLLSDCSR